MSLKQQTILKLKDLIVIAMLNRNLDLVDMIKHAVKCVRLHDELVETLGNLANNTVINADNGEKFKAAREVLAKCEE